MTSRTAAMSVTFILTCAVLAAALGMGLRQSFGLFLAPMTIANGWTTSGFAFAIAVQVLVNGITAPIAGQLADRYGSRMVMIAGACLFAVGTTGMAFAPDLPTFILFAGFVNGTAVSLSGFPIIVASLGRQLPPDMRARATGLGTAGSSFGQFMIVPLAGLALAGFGWQAALVAMALLGLLVIPLSLVLTGRPPAPAASAVPEQTAREALRDALRSPMFWCLFWGFFVCGVHISFLTVHLPGFIATCHLPSYLGPASIALVGLFNAAGSLLAGELTQRWRRRELLMIIYASRAVLMGAFLLGPKTPETVLLFSAVMGVLWLSTVPPTVALCARLFGTRWLATIFGLVFLGHQIGGFSGAWLGGVIFDRTGSYDAMWLISIAAGIFAALVHWPLREPPPRVVPAAA
ncbi:MFS transporter [Roseomonas sp. CCTCC AB2023176]|uniref:MFS transporter n=1 Tax=Roseomonas sp. CCTCC AB2023176 TaxID=3342640 RepID=UPI0035D97C8F